MSTLLGELIGRVEAVPAVRSVGLEPGEGGGSDLNALVVEINRVVAPPVAVSADAVYIRAMEVVSDEVNEHGGRFSPDEFDRLCELIVDSPVLVAHDKRQLPVARNFKAAVVTREGHPWVKVWFYWPKDAAGAQDLASRIDSGVIREVSIGFEFKWPECSVCGADIRECEHRPFVEYRQSDGNVSTAHYVYREIIRVLETSLVYRGATPGTRIGTGLFFTKPGGADVDEPRAKMKVANFLFDAGLSLGIPLVSVADLPVEKTKSDRFVISPLVEGLPVVVLRSGGEILIRDPEKRVVGDALQPLREELQKIPGDDFAVFGWLVPPRRRSKARGLTLLVEWLGTLDGEDFLGRPVIEHRRELGRLVAGQKLVQAMPHRWVGRAGIARATQLTASPGGCRIYPAETSILPQLRVFELRRKKHFWAQIVDRTAAGDGRWSYRLAFADRHELHELTETVSSNQRYDIGRVVPVFGVVQIAENLPVRFIDPTIPFSPARRNQPDSVRSIRRLFAASRVSPPGRRSGAIITRIGTGL